jgi:hypothetical protein
MEFVIRDLVQLIVLILWALVIGALILALILPKTRNGKAFAVLVIVGLLIAFPGRWKWEAKQRSDTARANYEKALVEFLEICDREAKESSPPHPFEVSHLYIYDVTENIEGMWNFKIFDDYSYKPGNHISIISNMNEVVPKTGNYLLKRTVIEQKTIGDTTRGITYRGGRQEFIDTLTGEVKTFRINYYLGSDFARGVSCLDSDWSNGFRIFVTSNVGWYSPGYSRNDAWVRKTPRRYVHAEFKSRKTAEAADFIAPNYVRAKAWTPINPEGIVYDYNRRTLFIDGIAHYLRQTFNGEPLRMVGIQLFPSRTLISYETNSRAPSVLFQIRNKSTGQLLQEIYVKIPLSLHQIEDKSIHLHPWEIAKEGVSFSNGKIIFDIIQREEKPNSKDQIYFRYRLEAPWETENIEQADMPAYLNDGSYEFFALSKEEMGGSLTHDQIVGKWISIPAGALWEFNDDNTLASQDEIWDWKIEEDVLTAIQRSATANKTKASFVSSKDGNQLEITLTSDTETYRPFLLNKVKPD